MTGIVKDVDSKTVSTKKLEKNKSSSNSSNKHFWSSLLAMLQRLGKSLMYPIAVLPFAALLNRFGSLLMELYPTSADGVGNAGYWIGFVLAKPGAVVFDNLPLIFAIGTGFGLSKDNRGEAALISAVFYFGLTAFLIKGGLPELFYKNVLTFTADKIDNGTVTIGGGGKFSQLFYVPVYGLDDTANLHKTDGSYILNIGVLGGIISGCMTAYVYNRLKGIKLPMALSFFGGRRFVPMVMMCLAVPFAFAFAIIWPWFQFILVKFGQLISSSDAWGVPGAFLYAVINRFIQPFGLHHILNTFLWFQMPIEGHLVTSISGKIMIDAGNDLFVDANGVLIGQSVIDWAATHFHDPNLVNASNYNDYFAVTTFTGNESDVILSSDPTDAVYTIFGDINAFQKGMVSGLYQTGYFPMYWGGLPAAATAMILTAKKENRKTVIAFLAGVAVVAFLTGIDEPIVFAFIFVSPLLWAYNAIFTGILAALATAMHMHVGFGFSGGFIDYVISFANSWGMSKYEGYMNGGTYGLFSNPLWMLVLAAIAFPMYFFSFYFTIKKMDIKTPGREDGNINLTTTQDDEKTVVAEKGTIDTNIYAGKEANETADDKKLEKKLGGKKSKDYNKMADDIIKIVGSDNFEIVDNCATRLRLTVKDNTNIDDNAIKATGAFGVRRLGTQGYQIIIGTDVEALAELVHEKTGK